jgi:hypothetical protein
MMLMRKKKTILFDFSKDFEIEIVNITRHLVS